MLALASCKKNFTERPALDATTLQNYYNTAEDVRGLTSTLYGLPWSGYENRAMDAIGDVMAGNEYSGGNDDPTPKVLRLAIEDIRYMVNIFDERICLIVSVSA